MKTVLVVILLFLLFPSTIQSVPAKVRPGDRLWSGYIRELRDSNCGHCSCAMVYLTLHADSGRVEVRLAPKSYFDEHGMNLRASDNIEISGFKAKENGKEIVIAMQIRRGAELLVMRSSTGLPMWDSDADDRCRCSR
jgi:hypothetical protein